MSALPVDSTQAEMLLNYDRHSQKGILMLDTRRTSTCAFFNGKTTNPQKSTSVENFHVSSLNNDKLLADVVLSIPHLGLF